MTPFNTFFRKRDIARTYRISLQLVLHRFSWPRKQTKSSDADPELELTQDAALNNHLLRLHHQTRSALTPQSRFVGAGQSTPSLFATAECRRYTTAIDGTASRNLRYLFGPLRRLPNHSATVAPPLRCEIQGNFGVWQATPLVTM
jgi:hypothetical protein